MCPCTCMCACLHTCGGQRDNLQKSVLTIHPSEAQSLLQILLLPCIFQVTWPAGLGTLSASARCLPVGPGMSDEC